MEIVNLILNIAVIVLIFLVWLFTKNYLPSYMDKKGENLATKEDIEEITRKTEEVQREFKEEFEAFSSDMKFKYDFFYKQYSELYCKLYAIIIQSEYVRHFIQITDGKVITFEEAPFLEIKRFDIKGKEYLRTLGKYYIVDIGLRNYLLGYRDGDSGHILENIIYFELLRRGYDVAIGKIDNQEVDFIATKADEKKYVQVTESMNAPETRERELAPLRKIRDSYEKIVIALECDFTQTQDGIKIIRALDFLLE